MRTYTQQYPRTEYHTQLASTSKWIRVSTKCLISKPECTSSFYIFYVLGVHIHVVMMYVLYRTKMCSLYLAQGAYYARLYTSYGSHLTMQSSSRPRTQTRDSYTLK